MKLCAIYNSWDDWDMLQHSIENIRSLVDGIIAVTSFNSNYFEPRSGPDGSMGELSLACPVLFRQKEPIRGLRPMENETAKRNYGLEIAKDFKYTHFITIDSDEFYDPIEFRKAKEYLNSKPNLNGLVCKSQVYVKEPTLTIGLDTTLVPFIHKITPDLKHEFNRKYPFAWEGNKIRIDPTRSLNINSGVEMVDVTMHHYSWVRSDIQRKIRNSTARANLERMNLVNKFVHLKEGDVFDLYPGKPLIRVSNKFGLPEIWEIGGVKSTA